MNTSATGMKEIKGCTYCMQEKMSIVTNNP